MKSKREGRKKKPYRRPRLVAYGDFRTLTRTTAKGGTQKDGGPANPATKL
jgi:hypothetical protein